MGVDRREYVIYGFKMPYDYLKSKGIELWEDERFLPFIEGWKEEDYCIIDDGMYGEYTVFGLLIASGGQNGFNFLELPAIGWPGKDDQVKRKFKEVFGFEDAELGEPKVLIFSHYS